MQDLAQEAVLHTLAEVSAAFVGFSLVVGVFSDNTSTYRFYSIRDVAFVGLLCLAGSLMPSLVHGFEASASATWRVSSGLFSLFWVTVAFVAIRTYRQAVPADQMPKFLVFGPISAILGNLLLWWNLISTQPGAAVYVLSLSLLLAFAALSFIAAVFYGRAPA